MQQNTKILIGTVVGSVAVFGFLVWAVLSVPSDNGAGIDASKLSFNDANDPAAGPEDAKVVVRLYSDLQCPACRAAEAGVRYAMDKYRDTVRFVWNDFPLQSIHPNARLAANAARCAEAQGKFWEYKDALFAKQDEWDDDRAPSPRFAAYANELGLDGSAFSTCLSERQFDSKVMDDVQEGLANGVDRTPTVFVNTQRRFGMTPADWDAVIQQELASATST